MHPAYSIIFFTTASGAGYGLMFLLGLATATAAVRPAGDGPAFVLSLGLALVLVSAGLVSSAFHLGRPERALRAFTQWRTSWLSREACLAAATYVPAVLLGAGWWWGEPDGAWRHLGLPLAAGAAATVYATAMIYRSLAAVPRWSTGWVPAGYLALAAASGAVWLAFIMAVFGSGGEGEGGSGAEEGLAGVAAVLLVLAGALKGGYWRAIRARTGESTIGSATGLDRIAPGGRVHVLDPPHTQPNWLQREMGYRVARRHAERLRAVTWMLAFTLPAVLCLAAWLAGGGGGGAGWAAVALGLAAVSASTGILVERWLFFAEAEHKMALYYGRERT